MEMEAKILLTLNCCRAHNKAKSILSIVIYEGSKLVKIRQIIR